GRFAEVVPVLRAVHGEDGVHGAAGVQRGPAQGHAVAVAPVGRGGLDGGLLAGLHQLVGAVGEQGPVVGLPDDDLAVLAAGDPDGLLAALERHHLAVVLVALAGDLLQVKVGDVDAGVGQAPRDVRVVADDHAGHAGEGVAGDVVLAGGGDAAAVQAHLVPDGGQRGRQVRVVGQQGLLGDGVPAGHHPGVGADAVAVDADRGGEVLQDLLQARELALHPGAVTGRPLRSPDAGAGSGTRTGPGPVRRAAAARARTVSGSGARTGAARAVAALFDGSRGFVVLALGDDRLVPAVRVLRVQVGDLLRAEAARHQGPVDL